MTTFEYKTGAGRTVTAGDGEQELHTRAQQLVDNGFGRGMTPAAAYMAAFNEAEREAAVRARSGVDEPLDERAVAAMGILLARDGQSRRASDAKARDILGDVKGARHRATEEIELRVKTAAAFAHGETKADPGDVGLHLAAEQILARRGKQPGSYTAAEYADAYIEAERAAA